MRNCGFEVVTMSADGKEVGDIIKDGVRHIAIPFTRKVTPFQDLKCLWRLILEIKKLRPDIVHTHTPKAGLLGMLASWICDVPVRMHTVAGLPLMESSGLKRKVLEISERVTYACAHKIYPNSFGLKKFIQDHFHVPDKKIKIIGKGSSNGIDTVFFDRSPQLEIRAREIRQQHKISLNDFVFSFVGRIVRDKGIVELIEAFQKVSEDFASLHPGKKAFLLLVGPFEHDLDPLPQHIYDCAMDDKHIILAGFQQDIRPWLIASDVFVFPSYREGFPNVVMQSSLLKVPCIVSDINGCNEIVQQNKTGVIVPSKDVGALVKAMKELVVDDVKRQNFGQLARDFVAANFKREIIWEELKKEYEATLKLKASKRRE
ncbi:glycosyltransferase family 4 protein [Chryseolinea sp. H1M3-3]|uniref:glycosyltransferase family 4 protein n=1 Tax=Chryseolinea sp. H1M3-3 TaxID=3034144 RepID=UPI0023EB6006|nr:glycosyltransferase family 4 protein [Chryseolinea sp. H1M3-3]